MKGFTQMDYIIAIGIFVVVFALVIQIVTNYFSNITQNTNIRLMTSEGIELLKIADEGYTPGSWSGNESTLRQIGFETKAYRINVRINNSIGRWYNQGLPWQTITNELVKINFTDFGLNPDLGSVYVYDDDGSEVAHEINGNRVIFRVNIPVNVTKNYTVYFDDDSNFTIQSTAQTGVDNLSEVISFDKISVLQYTKMFLLNGTNYTLVKNSTGLQKDFRISIVDNVTAFQYGGIAPNGGNIVALRRYVLFQNSTGGIRRGYLNIQTW